MLFALPAIVMSTRPDFHIKQVWYFSVVSILCQAVVNFLLLRREFEKRLAFPDRDMTTVTGSASPA
jgi:Na+-driven multidrug efflux pump